MKKLVLALLLFCSSAFAASDCNQLVAWGFPKATQPTVPLCQLAFYTEWDPASKNPALAAELLLTENVSGIMNRKGTFKPHPNIPTEQQATNDDYLQSGLDRGHLAPAGNMRKSSAAMEQSFYLTNMVPQYPHLNRVVWRSLESAVRSKVSVERPLYVITGPIYTIPSPVIGKNVWLPAYTYKIIYYLHGNQVASYIIPNTPTVKGPYTNFYVPLEDVEKVTNINFFPDMSTDVRTFIRQVPLEKW